MSSNWDPFVDLIVEKQDSLDCLRERVSTVGSRSAKNCWGVPSLITLAEKPLLWTRVFTKWLAIIREYRQRITAGTSRDLLAKRWNRLWWFAIELSWATGSFLSFVASRGGRPGMFSRHFRPPASSSPNQPLALYLDHGFYSDRTSTYQVHSKPWRCMRY